MIQNAKISSVGAKIGFALLDIKYFKLMTGFNKLSSEVKLGFSEVNPMLMLYALEPNGSELNYIKFYLAPYIND